MRRDEHFSVGMNLKQLPEGIERKGSFMGQSQDPANASLADQPLQRRELAALAPLLILMLLIRERVLPTGSISTTPVPSIWPR